jgi:rhodanese-related sulfurtransferase
VKHAPGFLKLVESVRPSIREVTVEQVRAMQASGERFHFVDVREDDEWRAGFCEGAVHLGRGVLERDVEGVIPEAGACVVLYCGGGFRSALAAESLAKMGYTNVLSMAGGIRAWRDASLPERKP